MAQIINLNEYDVEIVEDLERAFFEKRALENIIAYASEQKLDYSDFFNQYVEVIKLYTACQKDFEQHVILPATNGAGGNWSVDFETRTATIN